jgi:hypothetical protein
MHFGFAFAVAVLAAFGLRALLDRPEGDRGRFSVPLVGIGIALVAFATVGLEPGDVGRTVKHFATGRDFQRGGVMALTSIVWFLIFVGGVGAAVWAAQRWPRRAAAMGAAVVALAVVDALHFAGNYQPMGPEDRVFPPRTSAVAYLQAHADEGRFMGLGHRLTNAYSLEYGLRDVRGYDPPYPTLRFFRLWRTASPGQVDWRPFTIETLDVTALRVMSVLGARYVLADPRQDQEVPTKGPWQGFREVYDRADATIYRNERAVPRVMVPRRVVVAPDERSARARLIAESWDPREAAVVVAGEPGLERLPRGSDSGSGLVRLVSEENTRVELSATLERPGLVLLNDQLTDGWKVELDGRPAEIVRANEVMRGVIAGPGEHEIVWSYAVPGLRIGILLSLLALALLASAATALRQPSAP